MSAALIHIADPSVPGGWRPATAADFAGDIIYDVVSIASVAVNTTVTGTTIDLGASHSTCTVICHKASGTNQADTVSIEQSDDGTNWYQVPRSDTPYGNAVGFASTSGVNCVVNGRPCMRYVRGKLTTASTGSSQPAGALLMTAVHFGV